MKHRKPEKRAWARGRVELPNTVVGLAAELRKERAGHKDVDWWQRASTLASIMSSVVIASAGILISWSIQTSQLAVTKAQLQLATSQLDETKRKNLDEQRQEETKLAVDLLPTLLDSNPEKRSLAKTLLQHRSAAPNSLNEVFKALAEVKDSRPEVRKAAIVTLARSDNQLARSAVRQIALDEKRPSEERSLAISRDSAAVYQILARSNANSEIHVGTGFRVKGTNGIITALHNVVNCKSIEAVSRGELVHLTIDQIDPTHDAALLRQSDDAGSAGSSFETAKAKDSKSLLIIGYGQAMSQPLALSASLVSSSNIHFGEFRSSEGQRLTLPFISPDALVLPINATIYKGFSGAPLLDEEYRVVGMVDGSLSEGASLAWAIPLEEFRWTPATPALLEALSKPPKEVLR